jgi:TonB family protein
MSLFKISIISSLFLHCVLFFLLKNLEINNEKNENLDLQIVSQIITKNIQEPVAPVAPPEPITPTPPPPEPLAPVAPPEPITPTPPPPEPLAPVAPPEPITPAPPPPEPVAPVAPPEPITPTPPPSSSALNEFEPILKDESNNESSSKNISNNSIKTEKIINNEIDKIKNYKNLIYKILEKRKKYPKIALRKKWEGEVVVAIYYDGSGSISKINIHKSSGKSVLDRAALDIVNDSLMEDLPTTPDTLNGKILLFTIDFLLNT